MTAERFMALVQGSRPRWIKNPRFISHIKSIFSKKWLSVIVEFCRQPSISFFTAHWKSEIRSWCDFRGGELNGLDGWLTGGLTLQEVHHLIGNENIFKLDQNYMLVADHFTANRSFVSRSQQTVNWSEQTVNRSQQTVKWSQQTVNWSEQTVNRSQQTVKWSQQTVNWSQQSVLWNDCQPYILYPTQVYQIRKMWFSIFSHGFYLTYSSM